MYKLNSQLVVIRKLIKFESAKIIHKNFSISNFFFSKKFIGNKLSN
jgi:hypothetical protein